MYVKLMQNYLKKIKPNVGKRWTADKLFLRVKGDLKYACALVDN
jgi:hypothetical protein